MSKSRRIDSVGWGFFGVVLVAAIPACIYFVFQITHDSLTLGTRAGTGITLAFFVTAFFTWTVNSLLQLRAGSDGERNAERDSSD
ncbi:MAG: hypothetical protein JNK74_13165 [Candidatus Hydrogenedentes bacterium]|nr:hypothetical protein [Candidatus Hydrogenedentota bacterium]